MKTPISEKANPEKEIFNEALELPLEERAAFVRRACGADEALRRGVEGLLEAYQSAGGFISTRDDSADVKVPTVMTNPTPVNEGPGTVIDRYKLLQLIGEGGFGVVYMAEQREPVKRRVALKVIKLGMDTKRVVARFEAERQALALMDHPNIAKVLDAGATAAGRPYFVMELVRGVKITEFCDKNNLSTRERLGLFKQVCHAVQHAHQKGIIHRDIKPSNVLVTLHDGVPVPKVIDFGIAKATTDQQLTDKTLFTAIEQFLGTPAYMSPEQAEMSGLDIDTRTDIYSLGVLLYELLVGKTPFDTGDLLAEGLDGMRRTIREKEPTRPSTRLNTFTQPDLALVAKRHRSEPSKLASLVRGDLDWIVMKALEKDRSRRYETAEALALDVQRHLDNEPILARPASTWDRVAKWTRRRPATAALAGVIATASLACAVLAVFASKQAILATRQSEEAERARGIAYDAAEKEQKQREQVQRNVVRQYVANGARLMNQGDLFTALLWYVEALRLDSGDPRREEPHRIRIASVLRQCPKLLNVFSHGTMLYHAEFSPDGNRLVTASDDHTARLWDLKTGENLFVLHHDDEVNDATFSHDGLHIVTASKDRTARIWDTGTGALLHSLPHTNTVWRATFSPDGTLLATACEDHTVQLWSPVTGERLGLPLEHESGVGWIAISPDGRLLGTVSDHHVARIWDIVERRERIKIEGATGTGFDAIAFSPDHQRILICEGPNVRLWDGTTFKEAQFSPLKRAAEVADVAFSADSQTILACGADFTAQLWNSATGQPLLATPVRHSGPVLEARISPDGRRFVTAGQDTIAQLWSTRTGEPIGPSLKHILHVKYVRFNPDGRRLLFNSCDQAARLWDLATSDFPAPSRPVIPDEHRLTSPNGQYRLVKGEGNVLWITETASGRQVAPLPHANPITYASFNPDGRSVVTACEEDDPVSSKHNDLFIWDVPSGRRLNTSAMRHDFRLLYVAFSPGPKNQRLLTCGFDFTARVWDARTGQPMTPPLTPLRHGQRVCWGAFSPDGQTVVTASWDKTVRIWDAYSDKPMTAPLQHRSIPVGAFWSADAKHLHTVTDDGYLQIWDIEKSEPLTPPRKMSDSSEQASIPSARPAEDLPREDRPVDDLVALSRMLAVARIEDGIMVPLELYQLTSAWEFLRKKYPSQFKATPAEIAAWHDQEARDSQAEGNAPAVLFHHKRAAEARLAPASQTDEVAGNSPARGPRWLRIPMRDPQATADQIDLSEYYNLGLHDSLDQKPDGNDLSQLPDGLHKFGLEHGGTLFDVRGVIHLIGQKAKKEGSTYPDSVTGIQVGRKCRRLHFLEGASWGTEENGVKIGSYLLHYADGQTNELQIIYGREVTDWYLWGAVNWEPSTAAPIWKASNRLDTGRNGQIGLYKNTRENPRPGEELVSIDFVSSKRNSAPFLVALTIE